MKTILPDGSVVDFEKENIGYFNIEFLLNSLHLENRFSNYIPWTVLQHSLATGKAAELLYPGNTPLIQYAYLHDLHEAFIRDVPTPFKRMVGPAFRNAEREIQIKLLKHLKVPYILGDEDHKLFDQIDRAMCVVEASMYFPSNTVEEFFKEESDSLPINIIVACTHAHDVVSAINVEDDEGYINKFVIEIFKSVIRMSVE